jgi:hypothetical protein
LFGLDKKAGAIGDPWIGCFHEQFSVLSSSFSVFGSAMSVDADRTGGGAQ